MVRILHTADIHLGDLNGPMIGGKNARRLDTIECMAAIVSEAENEAAKGNPVNVAVIAGDLFNRSRVWADTALEDITDAIEGLLRPLCRCCEKVVLLYGTENHDNPRAYEVLRQITRNEANFHILTDPDVYNLETSAGDIQILALPGFDKGRLRAFMPDADKEAENSNATALINDVLLGLGTKLDKTKPSVLLAHYTVAGCESEGGSTFLAGQDVVLLPQTIDATGVTLAALGHIHKPQRLNCSTPAFYSGSPNQLTFNDEGIAHGFYIHILETDGVKSEFFGTPERRHMTLRFDQGDIAQFIQTGQMPDSFADLGLYMGCIVRVRYKAAPEQEKALNKAELQKQLISWGAFHVSEILAEDVDGGAAAAHMESDETPNASLQRFLEMLETAPGDAARLQELAAPLIRKADDGREAGQHTGAFIPRRIELKNYRSYGAASFDLDGIRMAMVNGPNGVGKSSLFMDSIADALFEESRGEEIGGWLRQGEKSGAITFEFDMGGEGYRVCRTRTKSGKGTIAFSRKGENGEWEDCGDSTMKLTQAKVERTLGMDAQTFCSIALIRQDAYGIFLEADSDRRMEVLSALLNLGVYVRLEELAKAEATEQKRRIAQTKDRMGVLSDQIAARDGLIAEGTNLDATIESMSKELEARDKAITDARREDTLRQELINQAEAKDKEALRMSVDAGQKEDGDLAGLLQEQAEAQALAGKLGEAEKASTLITAARGLLALLAPAEADLRSVTDRQSSLTTARRNAESAINRIQQDRETHITIIARKDEIEYAAKALDQTSESRAELDKRGAAYTEAWQTAHTLETEMRGFTADSKARISALAQQIETAKGKAALLRDSGCPIPGEATCAFLKDAQEAERLLAGLQDNLSKMRAADRAEYGKVKAAAEAAQEALNAIKDPKGERDALTETENRLKPAAALAPKLEAAAASIAGLDKQEMEKRDELKAAMDELQEIALKLPELKKNGETADEQRLTIANNEPAAALLPKCMAAKATADALAGRIEAMRKDIAQLRANAEGATWEAETIRRKIPAAAYDLAELAEMRKIASEKLNDAIAKRGGVKTRLEAVEAAQKQHDGYAAEIKAIARELSDHQALAQAFGIDGIQYMIIRSVVPEIMRRANETLAAMTGGRMAVDFRTEREQRSNSKIVNSLDVWINSITGGSRPYSSYSGGEKVKIALAVTLGLADVKARRAGVQLGMLFIDEPPFLDSDGTEAYADALANMAVRNPSMRILAISHDPTMKARFRQNITVAAGDGGSEAAME